MHDIYIRLAFLQLKIRMPNAQYRFRFAICIWGETTHASQESEGHKIGGDGFIGK